MSMPSVPSEDATPAPVFGRLATADTAPRVSVVAPMFNEEGGAARLVREIAAATAGLDAEIVIVDDASRDGTLAALRALAPELPALRIVRHHRNAGQSRAVRTGVFAARAPMVVTLDGDGQNDPADIPALVADLEAAGPLVGMVAGQRVKRQDTAAKRWASRVANQVRAGLLKDGARDTGCGLKAFWRDAYLRLPYFDHSHRYLPALMRREGFEVRFRDVSHRPRTHGASKYTNLGRLAVAFRDLLGVMWLNGRARSPGEISEVQTGPR